jgi:hypothetical protein
LAEKPPSAFFRQERAADWRFGLFATSVAKRPPIRSLFRAAESVCDGDIAVTALRDGNMFPADQQRSCWRINFKLIRPPETGVTDAGGGEPPNNCILRIQLSAASAD